MHLILKLPFFADDTNLHISHHDIHVLQSQIKQEVNKISNWMLYNKLSINYKKKLFYPCY